MLVRFTISWRRWASIILIDSSANSASKRATAGTTQCRSARNGGRAASGGAQPATYGSTQRFPDLPSLRVNEVLWSSFGIPIHTRPIDKSEGVGLGVAADGRIVAPVPVVVQAE